MPAWTRTEFRKLSQAIRRVRRTRDAMRFPDEVLGALRGLIAADICVVDWKSGQGGALPLRTVYDPGGAIDRAVNEAVHRHLHENPMYGRRTREAVSISDHLSRARWHGTALYSEAYGRAGQEDGLAIDLPFPDGSLASLCVTRGRRGFHAVEREQLTQLGPHVADAYLALRAEHRMTGHATWIAVAADGRLLSCSEHARLLLARYLGARSILHDRLPDPLAAWLHHCRATDFDVPSVHRIEGHEASLVLRHVPSEVSPEESFVLLTEKPHASRPALSPRESEVLHWLTEGKSNAEIACLLAIQPGTVKRHLENLYAKLGVENRHAACLWALGRGISQ